MAVVTKRRPRRGRFSWLAFALVILLGALGPAAYGVYEMLVPAFISYHSGRPLP